MVIGKGCQCHEKKDDEKKEKVFQYNLITPIEQKNDVKLVFNKQNEDVMYKKIDVCHNNSLEKEKSFVKNFISKKNIYVYQTDNFMLGNKKIIKHGQNSIFDTRILRNFSKIIFSLNLSDLLNNKNFKQLNLINDIKQIEMSTNSNTNFSNNYYHNYNLYKPVFNNKNEQWHLKTDFREKNQKNNVNIKNDRINKTSKHFLGDLQNFTNDVQKDKVDIYKQDNMYTTRSLNRGYDFSDRNQINKRKSDFKLERFKLKMMQNKKFLSNKRYYNDFEIMKTKPVSELNKFTVVPINKTINNFLDQQNFVDLNSEDYKVKFKPRNMPQPDRFPEINILEYEKMLKNEEIKRKQLISNTVQYKRSKSDDFTNEHKKYIRQFDRMPSINSTTNQKNIYHLKDNNQGDYRNQTFKQNTNLQKKFMHNAGPNYENNINMQRERRLYDLSNNNLYNSNFYSQEVRNRNIDSAAYFHPFNKISESHARELNHLKNRNIYSDFNRMNKHALINNNNFYKREFQNNRSSPKLNTFNQICETEEMVTHEAALGLIKLSKFFKKKD